MKTAPRYLLPAIFGLFLALAPCTAAELVPLQHAHAHNDYEHRRPLMDALDHGFCSVEADVWLVDGKLLVAHDRKNCKPDRTLEKLYLDPLRERIQKNGGHVYDKSTRFYLLIDVKSAAQPTNAVVHQVLHDYAGFLTEFRPGNAQIRAVTAVISGNRFVDLRQKEFVRYAAYDGRLPDLETNPPKEVYPWISSSWYPTFSWRGVGPIPEKEKRKMRELADKAHRQGRQLRFWGAPDVPAVWRELRAAGVDWVNSDDLDGLDAFFAR